MARVTCSYCGETVEAPDAGAVAGLCSRCGQAFAPRVQSSSPAAPALPPGRAEQVAWMLRILMAAGLCLVDCSLVVSWLRPVLEEHGWEVVPGIWFNLVVFGIPALIGLGFWLKASLRARSRPAGKPPDRRSFVRRHLFWLLVGGNFAVVSLILVIRHRRPPSPPTVPVVRVLTLPERPSARPAFSPDGRQALTGHNDGSVYLWDLETGQEVRRLEGGPGPINALAFAPDGRRVLTGHNDGARLWHLETGRELRRLRAKESRVNWWGPAGSNTDRQRLPKLGIISVAFSPGGRRAVTGDMDGLLFLWDLKTGRKLRSLKGHTTDIRDVAFSPDGRRILSCSDPQSTSRYAKTPYDRSVRLWDAASGRQLRLWKPEPTPLLIRRVAFAAGGRQVLAAHLYGTVWVWDARSGQELRRFDGPRYRTPDWCAVALFAGGRRALWVITGNGEREGEMRLFDVAGGKVLHAGRLGPPNDAVGSPDGRRLLTAGNDGKLWLWELPAPP